MKKLGLVMLLLASVQTLSAQTAQLGFVQVCKVAGAGVGVGTNFTFNIPSAIPPQSTQVTVAAGTAPLGTCSASVLVPAGSVAITETLPAGTVLAGVSTLPSAALLVNSNLAAGTATVTVNAGATTSVTFIDAATPTTGTGYVQVCKVAGPGVSPGTMFNFTVGGTPVSVPAGAAPGGTCSAAMQVTAGTVTITETLPAGTVLAGVSTLPSAALLVNSNLAAGTASVTVNAGGQTIVTYVDAIAPAASNGYVQVCKVAGPGVAVGTMFNFTVGGSPIPALAAGAAPGGTCGAPVQVTAGAVGIQETVPGPGGAVPTDVFTLPSAGSLASSNLAAGTASVTVNAGEQTIVTFTDAVPLALTTGFYFTTYYSSNVASAPDETLRIINDGDFAFLGAPLPLWASIYVFDDSEELTQCCSCQITPDGVLSESVKLNLTANSIRGIVNSRGVIKVISSAIYADGPGFAGNVGVPGLQVWMTHIQGTKVTLNPGNQVVPVVSSPYFVTETEAARSNLSAGEQTLLQNLCVYDAMLSGKPCTCQPEDYDF
jgi:hypothetical protein